MCHLVTITKSLGVKSLNMFMKTCRCPIWRSSNHYFQTKTFFINYAFTHSKKFRLTMEENCLSALHINRSFISSLKSVIAFLLAPKIYRILNSQRNVKHGYLESAPRPSRSAPVHQFHTRYFPHSIFWCPNAPHWCTGALHQCTSAPVRCTSALTCKGEFQTRTTISRVAL